MHLILTGATGLVGSSVLEAMLRNTSISKISILSRRHVPMAEDAKDSRIRVISHRDFESYQPELLDQLKDAEGCVWALGTSQYNVNQDEYVKITKDYAIAAAKAFSTLRSPQHPFRFIYVSGEGATQDPGRFSPIFARVKGETERLLGDLSEKSPQLRVDSIRPGFVDSASHSSIKPYIPTQGFAQGIAVSLFGPPIRHFYKQKHCPTEHLGTFLTDMAMGRIEERLEGTRAFKLGGGWVVENQGMREILGL